MAVVTTAGRDVLNAKLAAAEGRVARMMWAGAIANGAAMVALVGLIGNVPDPDAALAALSAPLCGYVGGIIAGGLAGSRLATIGELEVLAATDAALYESVMPAVVSDSIKDLQVTLAIIEGRFYGEAKPSPRKLDEAKIRLQEVGKFISKRADEYASLKQRHATAMMIWVRSSFACLCASTLMIVGGHMLGVRMQPQPIAAPLSEVVARNPEPKSALPPAPAPAPPRLVAP